MHKFVRSLITQWRRLDLPFSAETMVVAVSGGADSVSLLLALNDLRLRKKLDLTFVVAHFDHCLRGEESDADAEFVKNLAADLGLDFVVEKGSVDRNGNLEQNARSARYDFLSRTVEETGARALLTGHTLNDQAETFLINLIRGSGPDGLSAMSPIREMPLKNTDGSLAKTYDLVRPLLSWATRQDTEEFCAVQNVPFREDAMNYDPNYTRVRVRRELIPLLTTFNPKIVAGLARTAETLRNDKHCNPPERLKGQNAVSQPPLLAIDQLKILDKADRYDLIRKWLRQNRGDLRGLGLKHIEAVEQLAVSTKSGRMVQIPGSFTVIKSNGALRLKKNEVEN